MATFVCIHTYVSKFPKGPHDDGGRDEHEVITETSFARSSFSFLSFRYAWSKHRSSLDWHSWHSWHSSEDSDNLIPQLSFC